MLLLLLASISIPLHASAETELQWVSGSGQTVGLGDGLADLKLPEGYSLLNAEDTKTFETENGNLPSDSEIGAVVPMEGDWMVYLEYDDAGHISDDDKTSIDADKLLQSYKDGTEAANEKLDEANHLFVDGWETAPHYDEGLHSLTWSLIAHDVNQDKVVNYNVRVLTREGYVSVILVSDPAHLAESRKQMESEVLSGLSIKEGKRYEDYNSSTDKKSNLGLAALVVGGAGLAVAKKAGLLAIILIALKKFGIVIAAAAVGVWRWLRGKPKAKPPAEQPAQPVQDQSVPVAKNDDVNAS
ncbi:DUF2167 domain-containing protein [Cohnella nanjingensis]|uniref:DUF2167 domain-containing protein n=1 Tax=Cohnella nanjingensis TaxID=1387779 RepID=A0A7X0VE42_9BACL|nr:DUF2167 domain-containing protein [Cohnella nanjingensis]MBB6670331.1 DUF2167 domain-containing protein [Cohnella nanjingensis]